jgi:hypothetical protein
MSHYICEVRVLECSIGYDFVNAEDLRTKTVKLDSTIEGLTIGYRTSHSIADSSQWNGASALSY